MAQPSDFLLFKSENIATNAPRQNGGTIGSVKCNSGVKNAIFEDAPDDERLYGSVTYRKVFWKILVPVRSVMVHMMSPSSGADSVLMFKGTPSDLEFDLTGRERKYGSGYLAHNLNSGQMQFTVAIENQDDTLFVNGDMIYLTDGVREEFQDYVSVSRLSDGFALSVPGGIINNYAANVTYVSSVLKVGEVEASHTNPIITSVSGAWTGALDLDLNGVTDERWTIRFLSNTAFICTGARLGTAGYGEIDSVFAPVHLVDNVYQPYFTLPARSLKGLWQIGDTFVFSTISPTVPIWFRRTIKSGSLSGPSIFSHRITVIDPAVL